MRRCLTPDTSDAPLPGPPSAPAASSFRLSLQHNAVLDLPAGVGPFDVVFCRNVLIYFDVDVKTKVLDAIARRLRPGGYLLLGSAETTIGISSLVAPVPGATGLYRLTT